MSTDLGKTRRGLDKIMVIFYLFIYFYSFGCTLQLVEPQFHDQGLNPSHGSGRMES